MIPLKRLDIGVLTLEKQSMRPRGIITRTRHCMRSVKIDGMLVAGFTNHSWELLQEKPDMKWTRVMLTYSRLQVTTGERRNKKLAA